MVFYAAPKRQPRRATDGKVTDLPDELLLCILDHVQPLDILRFRLTCRTFTPAGNSAITRRMKKLYVSPCRSSLLAAVEICGHPTLSCSIEEVVILGSAPQRESRQVRRGPRRTLRREYGDWLTTWPTTFPTTNKAVPIEEDATSAYSRNFGDVYKPLLDALSTLPSLKKLSFADRVCRLAPGLNQVKQSSLRSFPQRHIGKASASDKRWSDGYAMFAVLAALGPQKIQEVAFCNIFVDVYNDLWDAESDFALSIVEDKKDTTNGKDDKEKEDDIDERLGPYLTNGNLAKKFDSLIMSNTFTEIRRRLHGDTLKMQYMQLNGESGQVELVIDHLPAF